VFHDAISGPGIYSNGRDSVHNCVLYTYIFIIRSDIRRDTVIWQTDWVRQQGSTSGTNSCPLKTTNTQGTKHKKGLLE